MQINQNSCFLQGYGNLIISAKSATNTESVTEFKCLVILNDEKVTFKHQETKLVSVLMEKKVSSIGIKPVFLYIVEECYLRKLSYQSWIMMSLYTCMLKLQP